LAYRVELTARATRDLQRIYKAINVENSLHADAWFNGLETAILSLGEHPARGAATREDRRLRQILYGDRPNSYRIIYFIHEKTLTVRIRHIRHGARGPFKRPSARRE